MSKQKILFIDRDGTLINEPEDQQIDNLEKFKLEANVIPALLQLQTAGYKLVMISNQDGLGTPSFPEANFSAPQQMLLNVLSSQGIQFSDIRICPHTEQDGCACRKPKLGLIMDYLKNGDLDLENSYVVGDRETDIQLAKNIGIKGILYGKNTSWPTIAAEIVQYPRQAQVNRKTKETNIHVKVNLDRIGEININTGIGFFDHMLEQLAKHGGFSLSLTVKGDLHIDEHHTVEDTALALGQALRQALGDKLGIERYGFLLPMDESLAQIALDLSARPFFIFEGNFQREIVGGLPTELVPHFFRSFAESLGATLHIKVQGENAHHMIESIFKGVGRTLRQAMNKQGYELPSTKGTL